MIIGFTEPAYNQLIQVCFSECCVINIRFTFVTKCAKKIKVQPASMIYCSIFI